MELMASVVIIGIVAAAAMPRFDEAFERIRFRSANRDMVSSLRLARSAAITDKEQFGVYFNPNTRVVTLFRDVVSPSSFQFDTGDSVVKVDTLPAEVNFLGTDLVGDVVVFRPNGSAQFTGGGNVVVLATTDNMVAISAHNVLASTGRVQSWSHYY